MLRLANSALAAAAIASAIAMLPGTASAQVVTRIETGKVVGGATLSVEKGVRVWRGLPPASLVVVNPGGRTPVTLNYNATTIIGGTDGYSGVAVAPVPRVGYGWGGWGFGRYGAKRNHPGFHHVNGRPGPIRGFLAPGRRGGGGHHH